MTRSLDPTPTDPDLKPSQAVCPIIILLHTGLKGPFIIIVVIIIVIIIVSLLFSTAG